MKMTLDEYLVLALNYCCLW